MNLTGLKFGKLTVISLAGCTNYREYKWNCKCDCGNETIVFEKNLRRSHTKSCGCLKVEKGIENSQNNYKHGHNKSGGNKSKEYTAWESMKARCYNKNYHHYNCYGGRGIKVCDKWLNDFQAFLNDVGYAPNVDYSLDRINNNGHYEPGNVRWADIYQQNQNKGGY